MTWKSLNHLNMLPLLGVMVTEDRFAMVSEWMMNGNINQFVRTLGCKSVQTCELLDPEIQDYHQMVYLVIYKVLTDLLAPVRPLIQFL